MFLQSLQSKAVQFVTLTGVALVLGLAPMEQAQASEVVKLARLVLTGKRVSEPVQQKSAAQQAKSNKLAMQARAAQRPG